MGEAFLPLSERVITDDVPCARCGYNLRTLCAEGKCPECGLEVRGSLAAGRILAGTEFGGIAWGAGILSVAALLGVVQTIWEMVRVTGTNPMPMPVIPEFILEAARAVSFPVLLSVAVLLLWMSRGPERARQKPWRARVIVAIALFYAAMGVLFYGWLLGGLDERFAGFAAWARPYRVCAFFVAMKFYGSVDTGSWIWRVNDLVLPVCELVLTFAGWRFAAQLMRDVRMPNLARVLAGGFLTASLWRISVLVMSVCHLLLPEKAMAPFGKTFFNFSGRSEGWALLSWYVPLWACWMMVAHVAWRERRRWQGVFPVEIRGTQ